MNTLSTTTNRFQIPSSSIPSTHLFQSLNPTSTSISSSPRQDQHQSIYPLPFSFDKNQHEREQKRGKDHSGTRGARCFCGEMIENDEEDMFCGVACARTSALSSLCANEPTRSQTSFPLPHPLPHPLSHPLPLPTTTLPPSSSSPSSGFNNSNPSTITENPSQLHRFSPPNPEVKRVRVHEAFRSLSGGGGGGGGVGGLGPAAGITISSSSSSYGNGNGNEYNNQEAYLDAPFDQTETDPNREQSSSRVDGHDYGNGNEEDSAVEWSSSYYKTVEGERLKREQKRRSRRSFVYGNGNGSGHNQSLSISGSVFGGMREEMMDRVGGVSESVSVSSSAIHSRNLSSATTLSSLSNSTSTSVSASGSGSGSGVSLGYVYGYGAVGGLSRNVSNGSSVSVGSSRSGSSRRGGGGIKGKGSISLLNNSIPIFESEEELDVDVNVDGEDSTRNGYRGLMLPAQLYGESSGDDHEQDQHKKSSNSNFGPLRVARNGNVSTGPGYHSHYSQSRRNQSISGGNGFGMGNNGGTIGTPALARSANIRLRTKKSGPSPGLMLRSRSNKSVRKDGRGGGAGGTGIGHCPNTPFGGMHADLTDVLEEIISMEQSFMVNSSGGESSEEMEMDFEECREEELMEENMMRGDGFGGRDRNRQEIGTHRSRKTSLQNMAAQMGGGGSGIGGLDDGNNAISMRDSPALPPRTPPLALEAGRRLSLIIPGAPTRSAHHSHSNSTSSSIHSIPAPPDSPSFPEPFARPGPRPRSTIYGHNPSRSESHMSLMMAIQGPSPDHAQQVSLSGRGHGHGRTTSEASFAGSSRPASLISRSHSAAGDYSPGSAYMSGPSRSSSPIRRSLTFADTPTLDSKGGQGFLNVGANNGSEMSIRFPGFADRVGLDDKIVTPTKMDCSTPSAEESNNGRFFNSLAADGKRRNGAPTPPSPSPTPMTRFQGGGINAARREERDSMRRFQFPLSGGGDGAGSGSAQVTPVKSRPELLIVPPSFSAAAAGNLGEDVCTPTAQTSGANGPVFEYPDRMGVEPPRLQQRYREEEGARLQAGFFPFANQLPTSASYEEMDISPFPPPPSHGHSGSLSHPPTSGVRLGVLLGSGDGRMNQRASEEKALGAGTGAGVDAFGMSGSFPSMEEDGETDHEMTDESGSEEQEEPKPMRWNYGANGRMGSSFFVRG